VAALSTAPSHAPAGPARFGGAVAAPGARLAAQAGLAALTLSAAHLVAPTFAIRRRRTPATT